MTEELIKAAAEICMSVRGPLDNEHKELWDRAATFLSCLWKEELQRTIPQLANPCQSK